MIDFDLLRNISIFCIKSLGTDDGDDAVVLVADFRSRLLFLLFRDGDDDDDADGGDSVT